MCMSAYVHVRAPQLERVHVHLCMRTLVHVHVWRCVYVHVYICELRNWTVRAPQQESAVFATRMCGLRNSSVRPSQLECAGSATRKCGLRNSNVRAPQLECACSATQMCELLGGNVFNMYSGRWLHLHSRLCVRKHMYICKLRNLNVRMYTRARVHWYM